MEIYLGKYFETFTVDIYECFDYIGELTPRCSCYFNNRQCCVQYIYGDYVGLKLVTNDQEDCINISVEKTH